MTREILSLPLSRVNSTPRFDSRAITCLVERFTESRTFVINLGLMSTSSTGCSLVTMRNPVALPLFISSFALNLAVFESKAMNRDRDPDSSNPYLMRIAGLTLMVPICLVAESSGRKMNTLLFPAADALDAATNSNEIIKRLIIIFA